MKKTDNLVGVVLFCQDYLQSVGIQMEKAEAAINSNKTKMNEAVYKCVIEYDMLKSGKWYILPSQSSGSFPVVLHGGPRKNFPKIKKFINYLNATILDTAHVLRNIDVDEGIASLDIADIDDITINFLCHRYAANFIAKHKLKIEYKSPIKKIQEEVRKILVFQDTMKKMIHERKKYHAKIGNRNRNKRTNPSQRNRLSKNYLKKEVE